MVSRRLVSHIPHIGFVLEQALGHVTHAENLQRVINMNQSVHAHWCPIPYDTEGLAAKVPIYNSNWTVRAGLRARRSIRAANRDAPLDALFIHTQVPAVLASTWLRRIPSVVSIDATPLQYDLLGEFYNHQPGNARVERAKWLANRRCFELASAVVAWSSWAKAGLVDGYEVPTEKVTVIPPGVWHEQWSRPAGEPADDEVIRILFVGADLDRKGGATLLKAFRNVRARGVDVTRGLPAVELHLVTKTAVQPEPGVFVHDGLAPNSAAITALYHRCHIFCLPTRADMLPQVLCEAGAAGLPLVSTSVGAIGEIVRDNETGLLVPPDDVEALTSSLVALVDQPDLRRRLGAEAAIVVQTTYDAKKNADRLLDLLREVVVGGNGQRPDNQWPKSTDARRSTT